MFPFNCMLVDHVMICFKLVLLYTLFESCFLRCAKEEFTKHIVRYLLINLLMGKLKPK